MSLLAKQFREAMKKSKDPRMSAEADADWLLSTGFLNFDFANGNLITYTNKEGMQEQYYSVGIVDGSINMFVGRSGCGKTTFAIQAAANIIRPYEEGVIYFDSIEGGLTENRLELLTKFNEVELSQRVIHRNTGVTAENFYERFKTVYDLKMDHKDDFLINTGYKDIHGEDIYKMIPTVYIIDSLSLLMPEKYTDEEELSGQMSATAAAKANASIFRRIVQMNKTANIILFVINHVNDAVVINPMQRQKAKVAYLKQGDSLPGGNTVTYLTNNLIKFDDHTKFKEDEGFRIKGNLVNLEFIKSRTTEAGKQITLVFNQTEGFDPELSLFILLKDKGMVNGAGIGMYLADRNDMKFSQKNLKEKLHNDMEFRQVFMQEALKALIDLVSVPKVKEEDNQLNISQMILSSLKG